ncbi:MAG: LPXTG cell wall anchor domain-containing protein, partial [Oscillospiraceae bacterium]|nr:LPXTG cell wall anchor domain-containing protein [Oscillospiraceae bacterium]
ELKVTITWNEETKLFEYTGATDENGVARVTIINQAGTELPSTGGTGTTIFYLMGSVLVLAAVVLLVSKKRMAAQA